MKRSAQRGLAVGVLLVGLPCAATQAQSSASVSNPTQPVAIPTAPAPAPSVPASAAPVNSAPTPTVLVPPAPAVNAKPAESVAPASSSSAIAPTSPPAAPASPAPAAAPAPAPAVKPKAAPPSQPYMLPAREVMPLGTTPAPAGASPTVSAGQGSSWVLNTITALGIVIGLVFAVRMMLMRMGGVGAVRSAGPRGLVEVLARTTIAPRTSILFLRINQRVIVAAQTPAGITTLTDLDENDTAWLLGQIQVQKPMSISESFRQLVGRFDREYDAPGANPVEGGDESEQVVDRTRSELSGLLSRIKNLKDRTGE